MQKLKMFFILSQLIIQVIPNVVITKVVRIIKIFAKIKLFPVIHFNRTNKEMETFTCNKSTPSLTKIQWCWNF